MEIVKDSPHAFRFADTSATKKIFALTKRIRAVAGGTSASKTISIIVWCIDYAQSTRGELISVVSESYPHLSGGAIRDFVAIMQDRGYWDDSRWVKNPRTIYTFETGSQIEFVSVDDYGKAHGPRRDVLFINEANNIPWLIADQLITRTRNVIWLDWNPSEEFWFYTEMLGRRDDIDYMGEGGNYPPLTFLDNESLDTGTLQEIEAHRSDPRWWRVYGEGKKGDVEGRIYTGWRIIPDIPHEARLERYGLDFGYHPDPAALVSIWYCDGGYILDEQLYARRQDNNMIASLLRNLPSALVIGDSAEPKSIVEIAGFGINIIGAEKGSDSKRYGIKAVQSQKISITARSVNLIREYRNYFQRIDKKTNLFIIGETEGDDHLMDALRYGLCSLLPMIARKEYLQAIPDLFQFRKRSNPV